jgi:aspartyl aminopeptidase
MIADFNARLLEFLDTSPTPFHAVASLSKRLNDAGFSQVADGDRWHLQPGGRYFVVRNDSAIVAFVCGTEPFVENGIRVAGAHTDSPCLKVKPVPVVKKQGYVQLGVEVYGGALLNPWFDRDLSLAGRVDYLAGDGSLQSMLIDLHRPVAFIPSLAIHLDRTANEGRKINPQTEMAPLISQLSADEDFSLEAFLLDHIRSLPECETAAEVLSHELMFYDTQPAKLLGLKDEFLASARLDNLLSCFLACEALCDAPDTHTSVVVCNDHEEVGSVSTSGAQGPLLRSVIERLLSASDAQADGFDRLISQSAMLSIDNAHGIHPNFIDRHDDKHGPLLNKGPVIKINANQRYASNSHSVALFKSLCAKVGVTPQLFAMRADMACGSTIGPITSASLGVETVDVGVPTFGMHSIRELAGSDDAHALAKVVAAFFSR